MPHQTSRVGQRVDLIRVSDEPHDLYRSDGTPVLKKTRVGMIVEKDVKSYTVVCPDCREPARYNHASEPICPSCGLICDGQQGEEVRREESIVIDKRAAGRSPSEGTAKP